MALSSKGIRLAAATAAVSSALGLSVVLRRDGEADTPPRLVNARGEQSRLPAFAPVSSVSPSASGMLPVSREFVAASTSGSKPADKEASEKDGKPLKKRERRFQAFASCEHDGQLFMTAQDFLESVTKQDPRARRHRKQLSDADVTRMLRSTPGLKQGSSGLFRKMWNECLFSYADYLFMLSVLTKPQQHFEIAFRMLDVDGNKSVELNEFLKFQAAVNKSSALRSGEEVDSSSLLCHFFGQNGKGVLRFQDFFSFMDNLQREVLELEFINHSQSMRVISELEFAEILLRAAHISERDVEIYMERLRSRLDESHGISFEQFCNFNKFLNNLRDFEIVVKMYTVAGHAISKGQFQRAVKACMGYGLDEHLVDTVFKLFDTDGDDRLSHEEFIVVMQNRVQRGFGGKRTGWEGFKACVRKQVSS